MVSYVFLLAICIVACNAALPIRFIFPARNKGYYLGANRLGEGGIRSNEIPPWLGGIVTYPGANRDQNNNLVGQVIKIDGEHLMYPADVAARPYRFTRPINIWNTLESIAEGKRPDASTVQMPLPEHIKHDILLNVHNHYRKRRPINYLDKGDFVIEGDQEELRDRKWSYDDGRPILERDPDSYPEDCNVYTWTNHPREGKWRIGLEEQEQIPMQSSVRYGGPSRKRFRLKRDIKDLKFVKIPVNITKDKCNGMECEAKTTNERDKICSDFSSDNGSPVICGDHNVLTYVVTGNNPAEHRDCKDTFKVTKMADLVPSITRYIPDI